MKLIQRLGLLAVASLQGVVRSPLQHLGPHNVLEWVVYLGVLALFLTLLIRVLRGRDRP